MVGFFLAPSGCPWYTRNMVRKNLNCVAISLKLPVKLLARLDAFAEANEWTRTETLRRGFEAIEREWTAVYRPESLELVETLCETNAPEGAD
jgi:hypothetical protein